MKNARGLQMILYRADDNSKGWQEMISVAPNFITIVISLIFTCPLKGDKESGVWIDTIENGMNWLRKWHSGNASDLDDGYVDFSEDFILSIKISCP